MLTSMINTSTSRLYTVAHGHFNASVPFLVFQVYNTPHSDELLVILQTLLRIETDNDDG